MPNPRCPVCSPVYARIMIPKNSEPTLQDLVDEVQEQLKYEEFQVITSAGVIYDPDLEDNLPRPLTELGVKLNSNSFITITDDSDEPRVDLILSTTPHAEEQGKLQLDLASPDLPYKVKPEPMPGHTESGGATQNGAQLSTNDAAQFANGSAANGHSEKTQAVLDDAAAGSKRKRDLVEGMQLAQKRAKPDTDAINIDDDDEPKVEAQVNGDNGAIMVDDD